MSILSSARTRSRSLSSPGTRDEAPLALPVHEENPYLIARREWNERYGEYIANERTWKKVAFACIGLAGLAVCGVVYMGSRSQIQPYVVEVDKLGDPLVVGPASEARSADARVIRSQLGHWVKGCRTLYGDVSAVRQMISDCYAMLPNASAAYMQMNEYFKKNDPFKRASDLSVNVVINSVLPISDKVWRIEWQEMTAPRTGDRPTAAHWQADVTIAQNPPADVATLMINPMGIYVLSYSWSERL